VYRWTRAKQRKLCRIGGEWGMPKNQAYYQDFGSFVLDFRTNSEFILWNELYMPVTGTLVDFFFHSHHMYSLDLWIISADASDLGLTSPTYFQQAIDIPVNLTGRGSDVSSVMNDIMTNISSLQKGCLDDGCTRTPQVRCGLKHDMRFEEDNGKVVPRQRYPDCAPWDVTRGEKFTAIGFYIPQASWKANIIYAHNVLYAIALPASGTDAFPHAHVWIPEYMHQDIRRR